MKRVHHPLTQSLLSLVLDDQCLLCQRVAPVSFCRDCEQQIRGCQLSGQQVRDVLADDLGGEHLKDQLGAQVGEGLPLMAWGDYDGALRQAIALLKFHNTPQLAHPLGRWMGQAWLEQQSLMLKDTSKERLRPMVLAIPMHVDKKKERGYDQAELLAEAFCSVTRLPIARQGLVRQRLTRPQFELSGAERQTNVQGAFVLGEKLLHRPPKDGVVLVDDIYTSGATVRAAIATLQQHHIPVHGVIVLAQATTQPSPQSFACSAPS